MRERERERKREREQQDWEWSSSRDVRRSSSRRLREEVAAGWGKGR